MDREPTQTPSGAPYPGETERARTEAGFAELQVAPLVTGTAYHSRAGGHVWMRDRLQCTRLSWKGCTIYVRLNERRPTMEDGPCVSRLNAAQKFQEVLEVCCDREWALPEAMIMVRQLERAGRPREKWRGVTVSAKWTPGVAARMNWRSESDALGTEAQAGNSLPATRKLDAESRNEPESDARRAALLSFQWLRILGLSTEQAEAVMEVHRDQLRKIGRELKRLANAAAQACAARTEERRKPHLRKLSLAVEQADQFLANNDPLFAIEGDREQCPSAGGP